MDLELMLTISGGAEEGAGVLPVIDFLPTPKAGTEVIPQPRGEDDHK